MHGEYTRNQFSLTQKSRKQACNITLTDIYAQLAILNKKVDNLERILIPEVEATKKDLQEAEDALEEYKQGKTVKLEDI